MLEIVDIWLKRCSDGRHVCYCSPFVLELFCCSCSPVIHNYGIHQYRSPTFTTVMSLPHIGEYIVFELDLAASIAHLTSDSVDDPEVTKALAHIKPQKYAGCVCAVRHNTYLLER